MKVKRWQDIRTQAVAQGHLDGPEILSRKDEMLGEVRAFKLAELRAAAGLSQQDVADELQVSQSRISRIEHGELDKTELITLRKFARALGGELELTLKLGDEQFRLG